MRAARHLAVALTAAGVLAACGKKGPPLTPIVRVPAAAAISDPRRTGSDVFVTVTIPQQNIDNSRPASVARVEVYGATAVTPPSRARFLEIATLVSSVPVARAADPEEPNEPVPAPDPAAAEQGTMVVVRDRLTPDELRPRELAVADAERRRLAEDERRRAAAGTPPPQRVTVLRRFYMAIAFSDRNRPGPPSSVVELPLFALPDPPTGLRPTVGSTNLHLEWQPSGGLIGWLMDTALPQEQPPLADVVARPAATTAVAELPPGPTLYNIYRDIAPDPLLLPAATAAREWLTAVPRPLNASPQSGLSFDDALERDERQRCYHVRAVRGSFESDPSERFCVTPIDTFAPATPTGLAAIVGEGVINLIWEPNGEEDLGGYIVLRRDAPDATLLQLTPTPISETRYTDRNVTAGTSYTYEVRAVDTRIPLPNVSDGARVTDTAR